MSSDRVIIDVREPAEYAAGHVAQAINLPPAELMAGATKLNSLDKNTELILYCISGSRSNASIQLLKQLGFTNLVNGINAAHVEKNYV